MLTKGNVPLERCHEAFSDDDLMKLVGRRRRRRHCAATACPRRDATASMPVEGLDLRRTVYLFGIAGRPRTAAASTFMNLLRAADWRRRAN